MKAPLEPPRLAGWLVDRFQGRARSGTLRGDLDEEYLTHILPERGRRRAGLWYWRQALFSLPILMTAGAVPRGPGGWFPGRAADLKYAWRAVRRRPLAGMAIVLTFALALGANSAVFSVAYGVLLRPLPFSQGEQLVRIHPDELFYTNLADARRFGARAASLEQIAPWGRTLFVFTEGSEGEEARGAAVEWNHFTMLGAAPTLGRSFNREDAHWPYESVVISHSLWVRRFGADPAMAGRRVEINGRPRTVIGVMGADHVPMETDWLAWAPLPLDAEAARGRAMAVNGRLRTGVPFEEAARDVRQAWSSVWAEDGYRATPEELSEIRVIPLREHLLGDATGPLRVLLVTALGVVVLACVNIANLLLAQGGARKGEVAVRRALGASGGRVLWQLVLEVVILALLGGALGLALAAGFLEWAGGRLPASFPRSGELGVGVATVLYAGLSLLGAGLIAGVVPGIRTVAGSFRSQITGRHGKRGRLAGGLVAVELGLSVVLVLGAGLMLRSFHALRNVDPGFRVEGAVTVRLSPPRDRYPDHQALNTLYSDVLGRISAIPGVVAAGGIMFLPMQPGGAWSPYSSDMLDPDPEHPPQTAFRVVTPGYFDAMSTRLIAGRDVSRDDRAGGVRVGVINETLSREAFPGVDPVGHLLHFGMEDPVPVQVVGVVEDVRQSNLRTDSHPELYLPLAQEPSSRMYLVGRTGGDPAQILAPIMAAIRGYDPNVVISRGETVADVVGRTMADTRLLAQLLSLFGILAMALGAVGVYGVTAHAVAQRRREIGIRLTLGAPAGQVTSRTVLRGMGPVTLGLMGGLVAAAISAPLLSDLLFGVAPTDLVTFLAAPGLLSLVAFAALLVPAVRAGRLDPATTLREE